MTQRDRGSATKRARQLHLRRVDWTTMKVDACEAWKKGKLGARLAGIDPRHGDAMREFGRVDAQPQMNLEAQRVLRRSFRCEHA